MEKDVSPDFITMFDEAQKKLERQFKSSANLREYVKSIITVSSIIVSFFATFKIPNLPNTKPTLIYICLLLVVFLLYGTLMVLSIYAMRPHSLNHAVDPDLLNYIKAYSDKNKEEIIRVQIIKYLEAIEENEKTIIEQSNLSTIIGILLGAIVIVILFVAIVLLV